MADTCLQLAKCFELRLWPHSHPLRQFEGTPGLGPELLQKLEDRQVRRREGGGGGGQRRVCVCVRVYVCPLVLRTRYTVRSVYLTAFIAACRRHLWLLVAAMLQLAMHVSWFGLVWART